MRLAVDKDKCVGCRACEIVCSAVHCGQFNPARANIRVPFTHPLPTGPQICMQCKNAACVRSCPTAALVRNEALGIVEVERDKCIGCRACLDACPFHAIFIDPIDNLVRKCDVCHGRPQCINFCQKQALIIK